MEYFKLAMNNYFNFNGRTTRKEYWMFILWYVIFSIIPTIVDLSLGTDIFANLYFLVFFIGILSANVRRMHDVGKNGIYCLLPIYGFILSIRPSVEDQEN